VLACFAQQALAGEWVGRENAPGTREKFNGNSARGIF
jgi:hypothetical protein